jgi:hypothetical protein
VVAGGSMKTWLPFSRRNAFECRIRSRSRWNGGAGGIRLPRARARDSYERTATARATTFVLPDPGLNSLVTVLWATVEGYPQCGGRRRRKTPVHERRQAKEDEPDDDEERQVGPALVQRES